MFLIFLKSYNIVMEYFNRYFEAVEDYSKVMF